jgi:hypothetical protein
MSIANPSVAAATAAALGVSYADAVHPGSPVVGSRCTDRDAGQ